MPLNPYKIFIVDDHPVVAAGIQAVVSALLNVRCEKVHDLQDMDTLILSEEYNLYIIDLELPGNDGHAFINYIKEHCPHSRILVYTMHEEPWTIARLSGQGIDGAVSKNEDIEELTNAVNCIKEGKKYFSAAFEALKHPHGMLVVNLPLFDLSEREKEVLYYLSQGYSTSSISEIMYLSINTIKTYRKRLLIKFNAKNVAELIYKSEHYQF